MRIMNIMNIIKIYENIKNIKKYYKCHKSILVSENSVSETNPRAKWRQTSTEFQNLPSPFNKLGETKYVC